jgi:flagellar biosynthesis/type III secretory pathway protein FliH
MSSIIKSADLSGLSTVQSLGEPLSVAPVISISKHDEKRDAILRRVARLEEELRQRDAEVRDLRTAVAQAQEEGAEQGYESGRAMLVDIRLSRLDFPDEADLASLADRVGSQSFRLVAGDDLPSGGCVMTLRLGRVSVGIDQQWPALRNLLDEMASPEAAG